MCTVHYTKETNKTTIGKHTTPLRQHTYAAYIVTSLNDEIKLR